MNHAPRLLKQLKIGQYRILKNGSFLVLRLDRPEGVTVCKLAKNNSDKLRREIDRLTALRDNMPLLTTLMPAIQGEGWLNGPLMGRQLYYLLDYVPGTTLGDALMSGQVGEHQGRALLSRLVGTLLDHVAEHRAIPSAPTFWLGEQIRAALKRIETLSLTGGLIEAPLTIVNGRELHSLSDNVDRILKSDRASRLAQSQPPVSPLGHWNFHSQNIILKSGEASGFAVIDPDSSLETCDPMFGIARLLYSFVHDCAENRTYQIVSDFFSENPVPGCRIDVTATVSSAAIDAYRPLYLGIFGQARKPPLSCLDPRLKSKTEELRLRLNLLLCLLRGVAVNHSPSPEPIDGDLSRFRHAGLFLLLSAMMLAEDIVNDD